MASKLKLVDVTKLKKSSGYVIRHSEAVVSQAQKGIKQQQEFMQRVGMDKDKLRAFINSDRWPSRQKHLARQELIRWKEELKAGVAHDVSVKRKEIKQAARLLSPKKRAKQTTRRRRTGFV